MKLAYISGPMTGLPNFNYEVFHKAEECLLAMGYSVKNPAKNYGGDTTRQYAAYMKVDLPAAMGADLIVLIGGADDSRGANREVLVGAYFCESWGEAFMGFPIGWTDSKVWAIRSSPKSPTSSGRRSTKLRVGAE